MIYVVPTLLLLLALALINMEARDIRREIETREHERLERERADERAAIERQADALTYIAPVPTKPNE